jgi:hypothetical protein
MRWFGSWKRRLLAGLVLLLAAVVAVGAQGTEDVNGPGSFVGRASNAVMFVQWTRAGETVTGSLREAIQKKPAGSDLNATDHAFTGVIHGNGITLNLGGAEPTTYVGEVNGNNFNLTLPGQGSSLITVPFAPGEVAAYNEATRELLLSEYQSPCSLYVVGHEARVSFTGANAAEQCAGLVAKQPGVEWTTEPQANTEGQPVSCELVNRANEQVRITDEGSQYYGGLACKQLSGEGWG